jgi:hypothetical protein
MNQWIIESMNQWIIESYSLNLNYQSNSTWTSIVNDFDNSVID